MKNSPRTPLGIRPPEHTHSSTAATLDTLRRAEGWTEEPLRRAINSAAMPQDDLGRKFPWEAEGLTGKEQMNVRIPVSLDLKLKAIKAATDVDKATFIISALERAASEEIATLIKNGKIRR